jgi:hypothetical protein
MSALLQQEQQEQALPHLRLQAVPTEQQVPMVVVMIKML